MNPSYDLADEGSFRSQLARAMVFGGLAGVLETVLVLSTGYSSPAVIAYNFALLVTLFCGAIVLSILSRRLPGLRWLATDSVLLLVGILIFAFRGCLRGCGDEALWRVAFPTSVFILSGLLMSWSRRLPVDTGRKASFVIATVAMTLAALDFAARDENLAYGMARVSFILMVGLGATGSAVVSKGWIPSLAFTLISGLTCFGGAVADADHTVTSFGIEPVTTRQGAPPSKDAPNVLLVVMDTVRADHLGLYGYSRRTSPYLDALAKESLVFEHAIATGNYSLPSHASLFTGLLPSEHGGRQQWGRLHTFRGVRSFDSAVRADVTTLAERLGASGFATGGLSANTAYLAPWTGLQRGFARFNDQPKHVVGYHPFSFPVGKRLALPGPTQRTIEEWEGKSVSEAALSFATRTTGPFFLFLNYFDAHASYQARERSFLQGGDLGADARALRSYDSEIASIDSAIETLLMGLKRTGKLNNTIVVITADHGEFFGEKGGFDGHGKGAYEEILHIPLIVRFPERVSAGRVQRAFGLHEVHRVILDLVEGRSIDWVHSGSEQPRVLSQVWGRVTQVETKVALSLEPDANVVYAGSHKLIACSSGQDELYDLATDSGEERNLLLKADLATSELRERMLDAVRKLAPARPGSEPNLTLADFERLRALGYISLKNSKPREH